MMGRMFELSTRQNAESECLFLWEGSLLTGLKRCVEGRKGGRYMMFVQWVVLESLHIVKEANIKRPLLDVFLCRRIFDRFVARLEKGL